MGLTFEWVPASSGVRVNHKLDLSLQTCHSKGLVGLEDSHS